MTNVSRAHRDVVRLDGLTRIEFCEPKRWCDRAWKRHSTFHFLAYRIRVSELWSSTLSVSFSPRNSRSERESWHRQASTPSGVAKHTAALRIDSLEIAREQHSNVRSRRNPSSPQFRLVLLAKLLNEAAGFTDSFFPLTECPKNPSRWRLKPSSRNAPNQTS